MLTAYVVDSLDDTVATDGLVTLREALEAANTNAQVGDAAPGSPDTADAISFDAALLADGSATITLAAGQLRITDDVDIQGPGPDVLAINADGQSRVFSIGGIDVEAAISGLTITGGSVIRDGGGIYNSGTLTVTNSTISGNSSPSEGGGIYSRGTVTVTNSTISDNWAECGGGGIHSDEGGTLTVTNSTISGNSTRPSLRVAGFTATPR